MFSGSGYNYKYKFLKLTRSRVLVLKKYFTIEKMSSSFKDLEREKQLEDAQKALIVKRMQASMLKQNGSTSVEISNKSLFTSMRNASRRKQSGYLTLLDLSMMSGSAIFNSNSPHQELVPNSFHQPFHITRWKSWLKQTPKWILESGMESLRLERERKTQQVENQNRKEDEMQQPQEAVCCETKEAEAEYVLKKNEEIKELINIRNKTVRQHVREKEWKNWSVHLTKSGRCLIVGNVGMNVIEKSRDILSCVRVDSHTLRHTDGAVYKLVGMPDHFTSLPSYVRNKFQFGFPGDWKTVLLTWMKFVKQGSPRDFDWTLSPSEQMMSLLNDKTSMQSTLRQSTAWVRTLSPVNEQFEDSSRLNAKRSLMRSLSVAMQHPERAQESQSKAVHSESTTLQKENVHFKSAHSGLSSAMKVQDNVQELPAIPVQEHEKMSSTLGLSCGTSAEVTSCKLINTFRIRECSVELHSLPKEFSSITERSNCEGQSDLIALKSTKYPAHSFKKCERSSSAVVQSCDDHRQLETTTVEPTKHSEAQHFEEFGRLSSTVVQSCDGQLEMTTGIPTEHSEARQFEDYGHLSTTVVQCCDRQLEMNTCKPHSYAENFQELECVNSMAIYRCDEKSETAKRKLSDSLEVETIGHSSAIEEPARLSSTGILPYVGEPNVAVAMSKQINAPLLSVEKDITTNSLVKEFILDKWTPVFEDCSTLRIRGYLESVQSVEAKEVSVLVAARKKYDCIRSTNGTTYKLRGPVFDPDNSIPIPIKQQLAKGLPPQWRVMMKTWGKFVEEADTSTDSTDSTDCAETDMPARIGKGGAYRSGTLIPLKSVAGKGVVDISSKGRLRVPPVRYWLGERIVMRDKQTVFMCPKPGITNINNKKRMHQESEMEEGGPAKRQCLPSSPVKRPVSRARSSKRTSTKTYQRLNTKPLPKKKTSKQKVKSLSQSFDSEENILGTESSDGADDIDYKVRLGNLIKFCSPISSHAETPPIKRYSDAMVNTEALETPALSLPSPYWPQRKGNEVSKFIKRQQKLMEQERKRKTFLDTNVVVKLPAASGRHKRASDQIDAVFRVQYSEIPDVESSFDDDFRSNSSSASSATKM